MARKYSWADVFPGRVIETTGEAVAEETISPPLRERTPDPSPDVTAKANFRANYDAVFGKKLWLTAKPPDELV